jgi:hypothetical protein
MKLIKLLPLMFAVWFTSSYAQTVAIIDEGINTRFARLAKLKYVEQGCLSFRDLVATVGDAKGDIVSVSYCPNGQGLDFATTKAAEHPRTFTENGKSKRTDINKSHGNSVSSAVWDFDRGVFHQPVNVLVGFLNQDVNPPVFVHRVDIERAKEALRHLDF